MDGHVLPSQITDAAIHYDRDRDAVLVKAFEATALDPMVRRRGSFHGPTQRDECRKLPRGNRCKKPSPTTRQGCFDEQTRSNRKGERKREGERQTERQRDKIILCCQDSKSPSSSFLFQLLHFPSCAGVSSIASTDLPNQSEREGGRRSLDLSLRTSVPLGVVFSEIMSDVGRPVHGTQMFDHCERWDADNDAERSRMRI